VGVREKQRVRDQGESEAMTPFLYNGLTIFLPTQSGPGQPVIRQPYQVHDFSVDAAGSVHLDLSPVV
jgi:hypothetical protein